MGIVTFILVGLVAGFLAGQFVKGSGFGVIGNILIGVIGAVIGGFLFGLLGFYKSSLIAEIISATVGAVVLLVVIGIVKKR